MFLNEEEQNKISKNKTSWNHKKRKKIPKNNNNFLKYSRLSNDYKNEDCVSLTEHSNILNEYQDELKFLSMKRKNIIPNTVKDNQNKNLNVIICLNNKNSDKKRGKSDNKKSEEQKINYKKNDKNKDVIKMSQFYNLYHYLFIKSGLDCMKPSRFIDYLSNIKTVNEFNSSYKDNSKITFENIKRNILNLDNKDPENILIKNIVNEYYHCNFKKSIIEKIIKKINKYLINQSNNNIEFKNNELNIMNDTKSISINDTFTYDKSLKTKKEKFSYSNLLVEKLNNNNYKSCLSLTNDSDYFKSIIYLSNKYLINKNKNSISDNTILKSLEDNKNLIKSFKEERIEQSNQNDKKYLNDILTNKKLRRYIKNKLICIKQCFNSQILKSLDKDNFNKIINLLINYKIEDKKNKEIFNDLQLSEKLDNNEISLFFILLYFISYISNTKYPNDLSKNDLNILNPIIKYFKQNDIFVKSKILPKKKLNIKKIKSKEKNNNRIRIKIENNKECSLDKSVSLEERKIEESNKENKIIKIFLDSNDYNENRGILKNGINNNENINKNECINELISLKYPISNKENNNENNKSNTKDNDSEFNLMERIKNIQLKMKIKSKNNFKNNLLNALSKGNDIFKLKWTKFKGRKEKQENKEKEEEEIDNKDNINNNEQEKKIKNENNIGKTIITKKGTKIIIYDDFSEENKNDSGGGDYEHNYKDSNIYYKLQ